MAKRCESGAGRVTAAPAGCTCKTERDPFKACVLAESKHATGIVIHEGPDELDRYSFTVSWWRQDIGRLRGQVFRADGAFAWEQWAEEWDEATTRYLAERPLEKEHRTAARAA